MPCECRTWRHTVAPRMLSSTRHLRSRHNLLLAFNPSPSPPPRPVPPLGAVSAAERRRSCRVDELRYNIYTRGRCVMLYL